MKHLLAGGCSFTDPNYVMEWLPNQGGPNKIIDWPVWPELLAEKLGYTHSNVGFSGYDNTSMVRSVIEHCLDKKNKKPDIIMISLSEWTRAQDMFGRQISGSVVLHQEWEGLYRNGKPGDWDEMWANHLKEKTTAGFNSDEVSKLVGFTPSLDKVIATGITNTVHAILNIIHFCEANNIKLYICQMLKPFWTRPPPEGEEFYQRCLHREREGEQKNKLSFDAIQRKMLENPKTLKIYGFPFLMNYGNMWLWQNKNINIVDNRSLAPYEIDHKTDTHPNAKGHERIAEFIYKHLDGFAEI